MPPYLPYLPTNLKPSKKEDSQFIFGTLETKNDRGKCFDSLRSEQLRWGLPLFFAGTGWFVQSIGLHWATYQYIQKYGMNDTAAPNSRLYDSVEEAMGEQENINMSWIDMIAAFFPMFFVCLSLMVALQQWIPFLRVSKMEAKCQNAKNYRDAKIMWTKIMRRNVMQIWAKVMTCAGFLFISKGLLGAMTIVPDSSGFDVCKARLKPAGLKYMRETHTFGEMFYLDFKWLLTHGSPLRYCADMMFSGHTFVVTLFALGCYEMIRVFRIEDLPAEKDVEYNNILFKTHVRTPASDAATKAIVLTIFASATVLEQVIEIYVVEKSRFHYSMDVFVAIVLTFLLYTNGVIAVFAKQWSSYGLDINMWMDRHISQDMKDRIANDKKEGIKDEEHGFIQNEGQDTNSTDPQKMEWVLLNSRGDVFIPPCCIPCCCLAGREHVYSDRTVRNIIHEFIAENEQKAAMDYLQQTMSLNEGLSYKDLQALTEGAKGLRKSFLAKSGDANSQ